MKKLFFISIVALMVLAVFFIAGCQSEEDLAGEAVGKPCTANNVGTKQCGNSGKYLWECKEVGKGYFTKFRWKNTGERCPMLGIINTTASNESVLENVSIPVNKTQGVNESVLRNESINATPKPLPRPSINESVLENASMLTNKTNSTY